MTVAPATISQLSSGLIRHIISFRYDLHDLARMRRISKQCRDSLKEINSSFMRRPICFFCRCQPFFYE